MSKVLESLLQFNIIHGRTICGYVIDNLDELPPCKIADNISILTVVGKEDIGSDCLTKSNIDTQIEIILVDKYVRWISKIDGLYNYIKENYHTLKDYILYLDYFDTLILNSIDDPSAMLSKYKCRLLANSEPDFWHTGLEPPKNQDKGYYDILYTELMGKHTSLQNQKYGYPLKNTLNAGVFLGEKEYVFKTIEKMLDIMKDDSSKGFPFGCHCDQSLLRYMQINDYRNISADVFNFFTFWGTESTIKDEGIFRTDYMAEFKKNFQDNN